MLEDIVNIRNECLIFLHSWEMNFGEAVTNLGRTASRNISEGADLIVYCFRRWHLWGSKLNAGYSTPLRFYLEWSAIWGRYQTIRVRPYYNGYMTGWVAS